MCQPGVKRRGSLENVNWPLRSKALTARVSDTDTARAKEYALPIFDQLGHPMVFCNFFEADDEGFMKRQLN